jgi:hypothetical protein
LRRDTAAPATSIVVNVRGFDETFDHHAPRSTSTAGPDCRRLPYTRIDRIQARKAQSPSTADRAEVTPGFAGAGFSKTPGEAGDETAKLRSLTLTSTFHGFWRAAKNLFH